MRRKEINKKIKLTFALLTQGLCQQCVCPFIQLLFCKIC